MKGKKTTLTDAAQKIYKILRKHHINNVGFGIIVQIKNRKDHKISIKIKQEKACLLLSITGKYYKQELRIYDNIQKKNLEKIFIAEKNENLRVL